MGVMTRLAPALLVLGAAIGMAGCDLAPVPLPVETPEPPLEGTPEVALLFISGAPAVAADGLELRIVNAEGIAVRTIPILPGERIVAQLGLDQGRYTLAETHGACGLDLKLAGGREADVVVTLDAGGSCALATAGDHEPEMNGHPLFGSVAVSFVADAMPEDLTLRLRSLDEPPNPVPGPTEDEPDRPGRFTVYDIPQGAYEARVTGDGAVLGAMAFVVGIGADAEPVLMIQPANPEPTDR